MLSSSRRRTRELSPEAENVPGIDQSAAVDAFLDERFDHGQIRRRDIRISLIDRQIAGR